MQILSLLASRMKRNFQEKYKACEIHKQRTMGLSTHRCQKIMGFTVSPGAGRGVGVTTATTTTTTTDKKSHCCCRCCGRCCWLLQLQVLLLRTTKENDDGNAKGDNSEEDDDEDNLPNQKSSSYSYLRGFRQSLSSAAPPLTVGAPNHWPQAVHAEGHMRNIILVTLAGSGALRRHQFGNSRKLQRLRSERCAVPKIRTFEIIRRCHSVSCKKNPDPTDDIQAVHPEKPCAITSLLGTPLECL